MLVVRDLSGTVDTEAELARSQRQTEMILRAASEGVVGMDTDGRVVLVNPAAAQILGFRASDLGGKELHPLILHSRADGEPFPYEESPLADTLRSGRKHRVRGQVLWSKSGAQVPVDLTTAPVRDGDQLVGAVMTFTDRRPYEELTQQHTDRGRRADRAARRRDRRAQPRATAPEVAALTERHAAESADRTERYASELEEQSERLDLTRSPAHPADRRAGRVAARAAGGAARRAVGPRRRPGRPAVARGQPDPAPPRRRVRPDDDARRQRAELPAPGHRRRGARQADGAARRGGGRGRRGRVELIGPGRAQFAVHAPPIEAEVDAGRLATALAHLIADVAGVDSTGKARPVPGGGYVDSTIVVAAAQRGDVVRIEVRGPFAGGDPVHEPIVRGIVRAHGGVLQTHEMPGMSGSAYVLEVPLGDGRGDRHAARTARGARGGRRTGARPRRPSPRRAAGAGREGRRRTPFLDSPVGRGGRPARSPVTPPRRSRPGGAGRAVGPRPRRSSPRDRN